MEILDMVCMYIVTWQLVTDSTCHIWIHFLIGRIVGRISLKMFKIARLNCRVLGHLLVTELIIKGWKGLNLANFKELFISTMNVTIFVRCSFPATGSFKWRLILAVMNAIICNCVYITCILAVCCSWTSGHKANEPCLTRLQSAFVEVSSKVESAWTTVGAGFKPGQRLVRK